MLERILRKTSSTFCSEQTNWSCCLRLGLLTGLTCGRRSELGWVRRIPIVALLLGITAAEIQTRPGTPVLLKKRDLLDLNDVGVYLEQLGTRVRQGEG
jgi:hypothetical protein